MNENMVDRVASALHDADRGEWWQIHFGLLKTDRQDKLRELARAAIGAMREPTKEMLDAIDQRKERMMGPGYTWQAMIAAALGSEKR